MFLVLCSVQIDAIYIKIHICRIHLLFVKNTQINVYDRVPFFVLSFEVGKKVYNEFGLLKMYGEYF